MIIIYKSDYRDRVVAANKDYFRIPFCSDLMWI